MMPWVLAARDEPAGACMASTYYPEITEWATYNGARTPIRAKRPSVLKDEKEHPPNERRGQGEYNLIGTPF